MTTPYKIKLIYSVRFMESSLSNLVSNLAEWIYKVKCKDYNCFLNYESIIDDLKYKCLSCNKNYKIAQKLKRQLTNTFTFSSNDINTFILLLRKSLYSYEYMDKWEKFNKT